MGSVLKKNVVIILILFAIALALAACNGQKIKPALAATETVQASSTPVATETATPFLTPQATVTKSIVNICNTNPAPPELLASPPQVKNDKPIAFSSEPSWNERGYHADIYSVQFDGSNLKRLTYSIGSDNNFHAWTPDGKKILFYSDRNHPRCEDCKLELFAINPDGTDSRKVTADLPYDPRRSPDGKYIVENPTFYNESRLQNHLEDYLANIIIKDVSGSYVRNVTEGFQPGDFIDFAWSPTGRYFTFIGVTEPFSYFDNHNMEGEGYWKLYAYLASADGSNVQKLPDGQFRAFGNNASAWSPDGERLAFLTAQGIAIIHADGSKLVEYPLDKNFGEREIFWPDDNQQIVFTDADGNYFRISADFTGKEKLPLITEIDKIIYRFHLLKSDRLEVYEHQKVLSPDGQWIAYLVPGYLSVGDGRCDQIRVINTKTRQSYFVLAPENVGKLLGDSEPSMYNVIYSFRDLEWAPDSRHIIFTEESDLGVSWSRPVRYLFAVNIDGTDLRQVTTQSAWFFDIQP
jgi:Tol biopolymer transport system component